MTETKFDIIQHLKDSMESGCKNLHNTRIYRVIRTLLSLLKLRKERGYGTGVAIHAFDILDNSFNRPKPICDLNEITGIALMFHELTDEQAKTVEEYLTNLLPVHQSLEVFIANKLKSSTESISMPKYDGNDLYVLQHNAEQTALSSYNTENFQLNSNGSCSMEQLKTIIEEFCTEYGFGDFSESAIGDCYNAANNDENILITVTDTFGGNFLISTSYQDYGRK
ncbi:hypothetical protein GW933_00555 [Candidatus Falkowbacteria bacterium]|uniref:Uncharacterized protein n=1 Tax=Candidatus Buchananbacteria bacterium CG10_big_fil_rev_8_21_14_0_10_33_19 TaxID=1974525 RepID=A0A2H0W529_9BACT|nr:hypothetical protein [Candidatus Falkowbacteria bacterium]PIS05750.1 MAG: hypothetical protein COT80_03180 [Candidatus Buchananbacteria bacterium CG10_big_fil_rev_8_21_14_0_10_33_19]